MASLGFAAPAHMESSRLVKTDLKYQSCVDLWSSDIDATR